MATDVTVIQPSDGWERREAIAGLVDGYVKLDLASVKSDLLETLEEPSDESIWPRAERIARDAIDAIWGPTLLEECAKGLAAAREEFLVRAEMCETAVGDLATNGLDSWVARAIRHRTACDVCWDTLDERHGVDWHECDDGQGE